MWRELSLFTGAGGGLYGSKLLGWHTVCAVEWNKYAQDTLRARQRDGWFEPFPIYDDVFQFDGTPWRGCIDVLSAGFPCQPFSVAGKELAGDDPRNGWPHTARIIREVGCPFVWLENVPGLISGSHGYFGTILSDLHALGYDAVWRVVSAASVGAPHKRDRLWIFAYRSDALANTHGQRQPQPQGVEQVKRGRHGDGGGAGVKGALAVASAPSSDTSGLRDGQHVHSDPRQPAVGFDVRQGDHMGDQRGHDRRADGVRSDRMLATRECNSHRDAHTYEERREKYGVSLTPCAQQRPTGRSGAWATEPRVDRMDHGVASRRDRLATLGNGQVPQQMVVAFRTLYNDAIRSL